MGRLEPPMDWGKIRARGGEEVSDEESGDGRVDWWAHREELICPNGKDLPGKILPENRL